MNVDREMDGGERRGRGGICDGDERMGDMDCEGGERGSGLVDSLTVLLSLSLSLPLPLGTYILM